MNIPLNPNASPVKKIPYRMNPNYKERVEVELDNMIVVGIVECVEELEWVCPMVV